MYVFFSVVEPVLVSSSHVFLFVVHCLRYLILSSGDTSISWYCLKLQDVYLEIVADVVSDAYNVLNDLKTV